MREFSFYLLLVSTFIPIINAYRKSYKIYQLPFLYSIAFMVYIIPTLFGVKNAGAILSDSEYIRYTFFSIICFWSAIAGYLIYHPKENHTHKTYLYDEKRFSIILYGFMILSFIAILALGSFAIEDRYGGAYAVILYPARFLRPATIMLFILYLIKPSKDKLAFLLLSLAFSLKIIIIDGRRSEVFNLFITIFFPLFFIKLKTVPRYLIVPGIVFAIFVFTLLPAIRQYTLNGEFNKVLTISPAEILQAQIEGENSNEVVDGAKNMQVAAESGNYNYGSTVYNNFVYQYFSSTFFGKDIKERFSIKQNLDLETLRDKYSRSEDDLYKFYLAPTGVAAAFFEFGYGGFILFLLFGVLTKKFYEEAQRRDNLSSVMFYCFFATFILFSIYDSILSIPTMIVLYLLVFFISKRYARIGLQNFGYNASAANNQK